MPAWRRMLAIGTLAVLTACGGGVSDGGTGGTGDTSATVAATNSEEQTTEPSLEPTEPESTGPVEKKPSIEIANAPIGGQTGFGPEDCVAVNWLGTEPIPDGITIKLGSIALDPEGIFELDQGSCDDDDEAPPCAGLRVEGRRPARLLCRRKAGGAGGRGGQGVRHSGCHGDVRKSGGLRQPGRGPPEQGRKFGRLRAGRRVRHPAESPSESSPRHSRSHRPRHSRSHRPRHSRESHRPSRLPMADQRSQAERWISFAAGIVTPVTLITALLFYFGYVSARSQYEYFGIDVDTIGLSTQDYVMRSPQPLLVPLLVLSLLAVAGLLLHNAIQPRAGLDRGTAGPARGHRGPRAGGARPVPVPRPRRARLLRARRTAGDRPGCGRARLPVLPDHQAAGPETAGGADRPAGGRHPDLRVLGHGDHGAVLRSRAGEVRREAAQPVPSGSSSTPRRGYTFALPAWRRQRSSPVRGRRSTTATAACAC